MSVTRVQTSGITDDAVTTAKIANDAVTTAKINFETALVPVGGIIMWSGSTASIPTGWALCNGANGTPNLQDRFIVGAGSGYGVGATGGANSVTLTINEMPTHSHTLLASSATDGGSGTGWRWESNSAYRPATVNGTNIGNAGGDQAHENRPPYYALAFIMRVS
jgi:microcystin-dependent protein